MICWTIDFLTRLFLFSFRYVRVFSTTSTCEIGRFIAGRQIGRLHRSCSPSDVFEYPKAVQCHAIFLRLQLVKSVVSSLADRLADYIALVLLQMCSSIRKQYNVTQFFYDFNL